MNKTHTVNSIVGDYLDFFRARGHEVVPSAPLLPEDPTLLFTAAGMVPFKAYYSDPARAPYVRATSVQKCLRAGGKQSDLENVGRTLRHHTFFEMLGNFSFGDYFKKEAIEWGWELSVDVWGLDKKRIWISVFEDDDEAFDLWHKHIGFPKKRIVRLGRGDNFWGPVGDTGVCGPSSEMHYDTGREGAEGGPGEDHGDRYIEYWNLVFPQFFYNEKGKYDDLPRPGIDTGLGLERTAFILQGAEDNFHTDEFLPIRESVERALPAGASVAEAALAVNATADHVRALTFAMAEGIMPSNEGRGYVLRRLLRRALTKLHPFGVRKAFLADAVDEVIRVMTPRYPELAARGALVKEIITAEEERFLDTLELGMTRLEALFDKSKKKRVISGDDVFQLYDTFGFPPELTQELALDREYAIDRDGFDAAMASQKERARQGAVFHAGVSATASDFTVIDAREESKFVGYNRLECDASVSRVRAAAAERIGGRKGEFVEFVTGDTTFYPEGGGQVGDAGSARFGTRTLDIVNAYRVDERIVHLARWVGDGPDSAEYFRANTDGHLSVDAVRRRATERNHTATHLLHAALRGVLGEHVAQAGSLVTPDRLRFDFHHHQALKPGEIGDIERLVNDAVMADLSVTTQQMRYHDAVASGAMALFGEKYGDEVRVVKIEDVSTELCGGTHLRHTGEIGPFFVRQETAVGSGLRRIEALTGVGALQYVAQLLDERSRLASLLRVGPEDMERRIRTLIDDTDAMQKRLKKEEGERAMSEAGDALAGAEDIDGVSFVATTVDAPDVPALRSYGDALRGKLDLGVGLLCQNQAEKPVCLVIASDRVIQERSVTARDIAARITTELGYRGGGKPHMAQVGIPNITDFTKLKDFVRASLETLL